MSSVLLSNPGLPLAVYGNPGRKGSMRRTVKFFVGGKKRRNPIKDPRFATTRIIRKGAKPLSALFPGWKVVSVRPVRSNPGKKSHKRRTSRRSHRRSGQKATRKTSMAKTRRAKRSRRTGRFLRASRGRTVGRTYRSKKGWVRVTRGHIRRRKGRKIKHPAVSWSGRRGKIAYYGIGNRKGRKGFKATRFTNPKRRRGRRTRRNPGAVGAYIGGITSAPMKIFSQVKGFKAKDIGFTAGGAVVTYLAGGLLGAKVVQPLLDKVLPASMGADSRAMIARVVGASLPYTGAFLVTKFVLKGSKFSTPLLLGGALASIVELIAPGKVGQLLTKLGLGADKLPASLHGLGYEALAGPVAGMGAYVEAPSYSGVGTELADQMALASYVEAPSYSGVGQNDALAGYVDAPSYSGVGDIGSYLSEKNEYLAESYLDG